MKRRIAQLVASVALAGALFALVAAGPTQVWSHADAAGQWVVRRVEATRTTPERWSISGRRPEGGPMYERASIGRAPAQVAGFGDRLAILFDDGHWSLASAGGVIAGPALPDDLRPVAIASDGGTLVFLAERAAATTAPATRPAELSLLRFDGIRFADDGAAPLAAEGTIETRLLVSRDLVLLARRDADAVRLTARVGGRWREAGAPIAADAAWLANDRKYGPTLIVRRGLEWIVCTIDQTGTVGTALSVPAGEKVGRREVAATMINGELRLAWADGADIVEQTFDERGTPVGDPRHTSPGGAAGATATTFERAMSVLSVAAVVLVLLTTGRRAKEQEESVDVDPANAPVPAALGARAVAGLIDALPLCVASAIVAATGPHTEAGVLSLAGAREQLILAAGMVTYVAATFGCELLWGRTPGKALFGLRVVTLGGQPPSTVALLVRNGLRLLDLNLVPLLLVPLTALRQRLGDLLAGTVVIDERAGTTGRGRKSPGEPADKPD